MLYVGLGIIYLFLMVFLGVRTVKNGHWILFISSRYFFTIIAD